MVLFLIAVRVNHAGALWRDECAVVQLARMPDVSDITQNFQHEAFPIPFPILIRGYTNLFGDSDTSLRAFGAAVGLALVCALWLSARYAGDGLPIISLSLLGLNTTFLIWGLTIRGYGLGSVFVILAFGLFAAALLGKPSPATVIAAVLLSIAAVQCLVYNLVLLFALAMSVTVICLLRRDARNMAIFLAILALCAISFLPYLNAYTSGSPWSIVAESPLTFRSLSKQFILATGDPNLAFTFCWAIAFLVLLAAATLRLSHLRRRRPSSEWDILLYLMLVPVIATVGYYLFLHLLNYLARPWYFLALLSILAVSLDGLAASLSLKWIRLFRLLLALAALAILPFYVWPKIIERQSNIDAVARKVMEVAKPVDLIVVAPWQYGISFNRYYRGAAPWITLPKIADLRVHRYDLFREKMVSPHPIDDVLGDVQRALTAGNRVWFVGGLTQLQENDMPRFLSPAPDPTSGWDNRAYNRSWLEQLSAFVRAHGERGQTVPLPSASPVNELENVPLMVVDGWQ
jgi:hypothetical protein